MPPLYHLTLTELLNAALQAAETQDKYNPPSIYIHEIIRRQDYEALRRNKECRRHINKRRINQVRQEHKQAMKVYRDIIKQINDLRAEYLELTR